MMMWARIDSEVVIELTDIDPAGRFHASLQWLACPDGVQQGWIYDGVNFAPSPAPSLDTVKAARLDSLRQACAAEITGGCSSAALGTEHGYGTALTDQANLAASVLASLMPGLPAGWTTPFKCADAAGVWDLRDHTAAQIQQAGQDVKAFIVAAQQKLGTLGAEVQAATTAEAVQAIAW